MTETGWHIPFFGWRPTPGEFIWPLVLLLIGPLIADPWRRWLSRTWNFLLDHIASLSDKRRSKRIATLELKIKNLREFDDRKVMVIFLRMISSLVILIGMMIVCVITSAKNEVLMTTLQIIDYFKIPDASFLWIAQGIPGASSMLVATEILWMDNFILLIAAVIVGAPFAVGMFQMMEDFSDPPKAIQRLEERINALRAKST